MDENKLKAEITELLKIQSKPQEEVPEEVREYFTEDRMNEMLDGLTKMIADYAKRNSGDSESKIRAAL